jgi:Domain of unknown function (DUF4136)
MNTTSQLGRIMLLSAAMLFCRIASAQEVHYNFDTTVDFSKYKTYKWVQVQGATYPDQLTDNNIKQAVDAQLAQKGLTLKSDDPVDVEIAYQTATDQEKEITGYGGGMGWRFGGGMGMATTSTINIGTLVVDVYDPKQKKLVWRGSGTETVNPSKDPQKNQERLQKAVAKLLKNYPPKTK